MGDELSSWLISLAVWRRALRISRSKGEMAVFAADM